MSNGIGKNPLIDISKVYLQSVSEKKDDTYLEPDMKKRQKNNEKARKELAKGPQMKNPHFEEKQQELDVVNSLANAYKEIQQVDENRAAARAAGGYKDDSKKQNDPSKAGFTGVGNMSIDQIRKMSARMDKEKTQKEGLDPVGNEDGDVNNDGKKDKTDKYLMNRRKAIGSAIKGKMKKEEVETVAEGDGDPCWDSHKQVGMKKKGGKMVPNCVSKTKTESFSSNWRQDLSEVMDEDEADKPVKEKKVNNKVKINPKLGEAIQELGGTLIESIEDEDLNDIIESVYTELIDEGYINDDVEDAIEYALTEAKVTFGHDTESPKQKMLKKAKGRLKFLGRKAGEAASSAKKKVGQVAGDVKKKAANKAVDVAFAGAAAKDKVKSAAATAKKRVADVPKVAKAGIKSRIKKAALGVAKRMGEDVEVEGYEPMTPERKLRVDRAKRGAYDKDQRAQHQGDKKEADKQFKRRMAMDSKTKMRKEATEDSLRDRRMERGGVDGNNRYDKAPGKPNTFGKKPGKKYDGMSALEKVKASIRAKHGQGAIKEDAKMAKQSDEKLAALHKQVSGSDQSLPSNQFMMKRVTKEMNRRKKAT